MKARSGNVSMTRREFLAMVGVAAGTGQVSLSEAQGYSPSSTQATSKPETPSTHATAKSQVIEIRSERVLVGRNVHEKFLKEMIERALCQVTDKEKEADAWHALLADHDVIGLKFNSSGAEGLGTTEPFARLLVASLNRSGWAPERIVLIEAGNGLCKRLKTLPRREGWQSQPTNFGSGMDALAAVLDQVTAIVNVPFLKANKIAGMSGCLKNLSHAMVKRPGHFHDNQAPDPRLGVLKPGRRCAPYIGDIVASRPIRGKLRLHLVNALRTLHEPMFDPSGAAVENYGAILVGRDPVAIDMVGLEILNELRRAAGSQGLTPPDEPLPQHRSGHEAGLGVWQPDFIDHVVVRV
jgi:hypothetical protein